MTIPTLTRAERKRVERDLYTNIRKRFDQDMPKYKKRYTKEQFDKLASFLDDKTTAVMIGIIREGMQATRGVTEGQIAQVMNEIKKYNTEVDKVEKDILRKEVVDRLATIQKDRMLLTVDKAVRAMADVKGIGPKRHAEASSHIARLLRENS